VIACPHTYLCSYSDDDDFNGDDDKLVYEKYAQQILGNSMTAARDASVCQVAAAVLDKVIITHLRKHSTIYLLIHVIQIRSITADLTSSKNIDECSKLTVLLQQLMTTYDTAKKLNL